MIKINLPDAKFDDQPAAWQEWVREAQEYAGNEAELETRLEELADNQYIAEGETLITAGPEAMLSDLMNHFLLAQLVGETPYEYLSATSSGIAQRRRKSVIEAHTAAAFQDLDPTTLDKLNRDWERAEQKHVEEMRSYTEAHYHKSSDSSFADAFKSINASIEQIEALWNPPKPEMEPSAGHRKWIAKKGWSEVEPVLFYPELNMADHQYIFGTIDPAVNDNAPTRPGTHRARLLRYPLVPQEMLTLLESITDECHALQLDLASHRAAYAAACAPVNPTPMPSGTRISDDPELRERFVQSNQFVEALLTRCEVISRLLIRELHTAHDAPRSDASMRRS